MTRNSRRVLPSALAVLAVCCPDAALAQAPPEPSWQFGAFLDLGTLQTPNSPSNHLFRGRGTTPRVDELNLNMAGVYLRKRPSDTSRWGVEVTGHGGEDSQMFGFSATAPNLPGADALRRLGPTNISYRSPGARGVTLQGGVFSSFIGYDSLYAKDNFAYTRPWTADFTPYLMLGLNASYPVSARFTFTALLLNGYWHLAHANNVPSVGAQFAYKVSDLVTIKETVLYGPHQEETSLAFWRLLSNTLVERKTDRVTTALDFHVSEERVDVPGQLRAWWVAGQLPVHAGIGGRWSVTFRPELAWDSAGRWTGVEQSVCAITNTLEYRAPLGQARATIRVEHRYDRSHGPGAGFFRDLRSGVLSLTPGQHLLAVGVMLTVEGTR